MILTSNRTRELHDALKRRCLYHWIDYPSPEREREIVYARVPGVPEAIADRVVAAVKRLREQGDLYKLPGVGETLVWAQALPRGRRAGREPRRRIEGARGPRACPRAEGARGCLSR